MVHVVYQKFRFGPYISKSTWMVPMVMYLVNVLTRHGEITK
ncbi:hypothetical protein Hdeb2414_s0217g00836711 [Helianthus debilis subsp. tardiflorus]